MTTALEEVAATADRVADDQRAVARKARSMQRQRDRGWSWATILDRAGSPSLLDLLRGSARRLGTAATRLAGELATGLSSEGQSRRQIARRLGVTHQRITALVKNERPEGRSTAATRSSA